MKDYAHIRRARGDGVRGAENGRFLSQPTIHCMGGPLLPGAGFLIVRFLFVLFWPCDDTPPVLGVMIGSTYHPLCVFRFHGTELFLPGVSGLPVRTVLGARRSPADRIACHDWTARLARRCCRRRWRWWMHLGAEERPLLCGY